MFDNFIKFITAREQRPLVALVALSVLLTVGYFNTLMVMSQAWNSPEYSHGWLVPLFALVLLWLRYEPIEWADGAAMWTGIAIVALSMVMRLAGAYIGFPYLDMISYLPALFGLFLLVGGWKLIRWGGPAVAFLIFMYPLPERVARGLLDPLQKVATIASTFALQTLGIACYRDGNRIMLLDLDHPLGVVDACSGLRMSTIFLALSVAVALIVARPWWERLIIVVSAVPIALLVNVIRITVTGILHIQVGPELADKVFHDLAGWIMMPMAMGFLFLELQILSHLFVEDEETLAPMPVGMVPASVPRVPGGAGRR